MHPVHQAPRGLLQRPKDIRVRVVDVGGFEQRREPRGIALHPVTIVRSLSVGRWRATGADPASRWTFEEL